MIRTTSTIAQLSVRTAPATQAKEVGILHRGDRTTTVCKVRGQRVGGNDIWYKLADESNDVFSSARYMTNVGALPHWCHGNATTALKAPAAVRVKQAPTSRAATIRTIAKGGRATAACRIEVQQPKGGTQGWYYLTDGRWVPVNSMLASHATAPCH